MPADLDTELAFDLLLQGEDPGEDHRPLAAFVDDVCRAAQSPAPLPSPALAALLRGAPERAPQVAAFGLALVEPVAPAARHRPTRPTRPRPSGRRAWAGRTAARVAGLGLAAKAALGTAIAVTGAATAGATGVLPFAVGDVVRPVIEFITPLDLEADDPAPDLDGDGRSAGSTGRAGSGGENWIDYTEVGRQAIAASDSAGASTPGHGRPGRDDARPASTPPGHAKAASDQPAKEPAGQSRTTRGVSARPGKALPPGHGGTPRGQDDAPSSPPETVPTTSPPTTGAPFVADDSGHGQTPGTPPGQARTGGPPSTPGPNHTPGPPGTPGPPHPPGPPQTPGPPAPGDHGSHPDRPTSHGGPGNPGGHGQGQGPTQHRPATPGTPPTGPVPPAGPAPAA